MPASACCQQHGPSWHRSPPECPLLAQSPDPGGHGQQSPRCHTWACSSAQSLWGGACCCRAWHMWAVAPSQVPSLPGIPTQRRCHALPFPPLPSTARQNWAQLVRKPRLTPWATPLPWHHGHRQGHSSDPQGCYAPPHGPHKPLCPPGMPGESTQISALCQGFSSSATSVPTELPTAAHSKQTQTQEGTSLAQAEPGGHQLHSCSAQKQGRSSHSTLLPIPAPWAQFQSSREGNLKLSQAKKCHSNSLAPGRWHKEDSEQH